jgi:hypothetical protein
MSQTFMQNYGAHSNPQIIFYDRHSTLLIKSSLHGPQSIAFTSSCYFLLPLNTQSYTRPPTCLGHGTSRTHNPWADIMDVAVVQWPEFLATDPEVPVRFPAL